ncbi:MAG: response regulator transcription factor [Actinomycetota bacterium]|nr:response regulator transcription factor [Actinomycetota bacterium]
MRILVVEDEPKVARAIRRGLEEHAYAVDLSADGADALSMATEYDYDAVVLDLMIPEPDGVAVCRELRRRERWAPILMLTARGAVEDRMSGLDAGADDYLIKPFAFGELLARLRAIVRGRSGSRPAVLQVGDLCVDPASHTVSRSGHPVELTAREYSLLEFLVRHAGEVVTRTQILEHVWDLHYDGSSNIVNVYVGYIRRKLEDPFDRPLIRTVRGVGYSLELP